MVPRDRTCDGGSVFYGGPDRTNSGHDGACDDDRYSFSRGHEVAYDDGMHHIKTAISDKPAKHWDRSTVSITSYLPAYHSGRRAPVTGPIFIRKRPESHVCRGDQE